MLRLVTIFGRPDASGTRPMIAHYSVYPWTIKRAFGENNDRFETVPEWALIEACSFAHFAGFKVIYTVCPANGRPWISAHVDISAQAS